MSRFSLACLLLLGSVSLGCAATSPYDRAWVGQELQRETGHALGDPAEAPSLPPGLRDASALGEDDVVALALWNSPSFAAELAQLGASRADLADAGALPNPTLSLLLPIGPRQLELSVLAPIAALVQRPFRVKAAKLDVERAARGLLQRGLDLVRDARLAWIDVEAAKARAAARQDLLQTWQNVAKVARARHEAGDAPAFEAAAAEADATDAEDQNERAVTEVAAAVQRLRLVVGLAGGALGQHLGTRAAPLDERAPAEAPALVDLALAARPDVRATEIAVEAAGERIGWEKSRIFTLLGRFDLKPIGPQGGAPLLPLPGVQMDVPIFNWNPGGIGRAEAELAAATLRYRLAQQGVATDIRLSRLQLVQALASLRRFRERVLPLLEKAAGVTFRAFEAGAEPYLAVLEATRRQRDARLRLIDLEAEVRRARANLDRHVGMNHATR
ncbi:TolC family protein [Polyangium sorediatum]|uniref:TolC family protein n=1 Tax=Polyangium sorediatum TaxID=889274 RepID=A0ABT6NMG4_9BACT|nr:TolC family protein [Polyangium sorediatum]MDI1429522.1 TolC family protein [Polyangium sorediatum]